MAQIKQYNDLELTGFSSKSERSYGYRRDYVAIIGVIA